MTHRHPIGPRQFAIVASEYPPHVHGGLGVHVQALAHALGRHGTVRLILPGQPHYDQTDPAIQLDEIPAKASGADLDYWIRFCAATVRTLAQRPFSPEIIHCHDWMTILAGIQLREILKCPLVFNVHLPQSCGATKIIENMGLAAADLVLVNSLAVRRELLERRIPIRRIRVIPNGVDANVFVPATHPKAGDGYLLFVGRLTAQKGVEILLHAFRALQFRCPEVRLVIVGEGELELYLKRVARFLGVAHRVAFEGWRTGPALVKWYQGALAVVVPSLYEPFGIVALEAMACGRPVVASRIGGLKEIIRDEAHGCLFRAGDYLQLAACLADLVLHPQRAQQMGEAARVRSLKYSWHTAGRKTVAAYSRIPNTPAPHVPPEHRQDLRHDLRKELGPAMASEVCALLKLE